MLVCSAEVVVINTSFEPFFADMMLSCSQQSAIMLHLYDGIC